MGAGGWESEVGWAQAFTGVLKGERGWWEKQDGRSLRRSYEDGTQKEKKKKLKYFCIGPLSVQKYSTSSVIVNFMCQLDWVTVARYLAKYYSRCFCEGDFWLRRTFK